MIGVVVDKIGVPDLLRRPTAAHDVGTDEESAGSVVAIIAGNSDGDVRVVGVRIADGSGAVLHDGDKTSEFCAVVARGVVVRPETRGGV